MRAGLSRVPIEALRASVYVIPTDMPESDGTLEWDHTTLVLARVKAGDVEGLGYTYSAAAAAQVIEQVLLPAVLGVDAMAIPTAWAAMRHAIRNLGQPGIAFTALSAVDCALWDLKGKLLGQSVATLLGPARNEAPVYGSGGFTSYDERTLCRQLTGWADAGLRWVKMKVGRDAAADVQRVHAARRVLGADVGLFVDANGAYDHKLALAQAAAFEGDAVSWFEEPVSSDDLAGLRRVRERGPAGMQIAAGEYGYTPKDFRRMLQAEAVDVLQADATRCGGITGFIAAAALTASFALDLSCHCAPALHAHVACSIERLRHIEWFHDHVRIEQQLFDGCAELRDGSLVPDRERPGLGLTFKASDAARFAAR